MRVIGQVLELELELDRKTAMATEPRRMAGYDESCSDQFSIRSLIDVVPRSERAVFAEAPKMWLAHSASRVRKYTLGASVIHSCGSLLPDWSRQRPRAEIATLLEPLFVSDREYKAWREGARRAPAPELAFGKVALVICSIRVFTDLICALISSI